MVLVCSLFISTACDSNAQMLKLSDEELLKELVKVVNQFDTACRSGDTDTLSRVLSDEYSNEFKINKQDTLKNCLNNKGKAGGTPILAETPKLVSRNGNKASITFTKTVKVGLGSTTITSKFQNNTDFLLQNGQWQILRDEQKELRQ